LSEEATLLTVTLRDPRGLVDVVAGDVRYSGEITDAPRSVTVGQRLAMALEPKGASPFDGIVEVMGKVQQIDADSGALPNTPLFGGLVLQFEVARMTRSATLFSDEAATSEHAFDFESLGSRLESKVFKRRPVVASLELMGIEDEGDEPRSEYADTTMAPPPVMTDPGADAAVSAEGQPEREPTGVIGTLRMINLAEVVQGLELGRKTARIEVRPDDDWFGRVYVKDGAVVHAEILGGGADAARQEGDVAFFALVGVHTGTYRVSFEREAAKQTIDAPTAYLILEAMRRLDEAGREEPTVDETIDEAAGRAAGPSSPSDAPELSTEGEDVAVRIPTAVRDSVVARLDELFDLASSEAGDIIDVDDELVIEESQVDGEPTMDVGTLKTVAGHPAGNDADSAPPSDPEDVPVFTPAHIAPLDSDPDGAPVFDVGTGDFAPVTDVDPRLRAKAAAVHADSDASTGEAPSQSLPQRKRPFSRGKKVDEPTTTVVRQNKVFSGFFQEAREDSTSGEAPSDDPEDDPTGLMTAELALLSLSSGEDSIPPTAV
jgi:hypothetical protein